MTCWFGLGWVGLGRRRSRSLWNYLCVFNYFKCVGVAWTLQIIFLCNVMCQRVGKNPLPGRVHLGAALLETRVRRLGLEGVVHPHMLLQRFRIG